MIYLSLAAGINNWKPRSIRLRPVMTAKMMSQNHKNTYIFSLNIFIPRTHKASRFWMVPEPPYLWNVHFVIRGNTLDIGSILFSWSIPVNRRTYQNLFKFIYQFGYLDILSITNMHFEIYLLSFSLWYGKILFDFILSPVHTMSRKKWNVLISSCRSTKSTNDSLSST